MSTLIRLIRHGLQIFALKPTKKHQKHKKISSTSDQIVSDNQYIHFYDKYHNRNTFIIYKKIFLYYVLVSKI